VAVPKAPSAPLQVSEGLVITVDRQGQIYVEDDPFTREEFSATIVQLVERKGGPTVYVKGDRDVPYGSVLWVIGKLKESEIDAVSLIAEPDTDR
jgi:biopolymer transport protein ExbD